MIQSQFIYVLKASGYDDLILNGKDGFNLPIGFDEQRVSITRQPKFYGLFRSFSTSLQFVTKGKDWIQEIYEKEGTEFTINIGVYEYNEPPVDKYLLYFAGLIDLSTYEFAETRVTCDINESSLARKIMSRDDVKVNVGGLKTVEGLDMAANKEVSVNLHEREIKRTASYVKAVDFVLSNSNQGENGCVFNFDIESSDIENTQEQVYGNINDNTSLFWTKADTDAKLDIEGILQGRIIGGINETVTVRIILRKYRDDLLTPGLAVDAVLFQETANLSTTDVNYDLDLSNFDLRFLLDYVTKDEQLALICLSDSGNLFQIDFNNIFLNIEQNQLFDATNAQGFLNFETADRIINTIADKKAFYSDLLGRTDIGYDADGEASLYSIHSGKQIRAIPNETPSINLSDYFKSLNSIFNVGLGIEYNEVGQPFVRLEKKNYFFDGEVIATIHSVNNIQKKVAREWIYNEVEVGYQKAEYEEVNGLEEYNNKFEWTTSIGTIKNKLDLISRLRADGYGIEFARRAQFSEKPTEDTKYDNDNFIINVRRQGENYASVKDENYDFVENIFSPQSAYNLDITPGRMLRNNGNVLRAGIEKYLTPVNFRFAEQKADLRSQRTGEGPITENEDIDSATLNSPLWIPEIYTFESILTREQLAAISRKSNGIIKFSTTSQSNTTEYYYGWILSIEAEDKEATWELLRVNTSSPDVVLVDPEGSSPDPPPIIVEPSLTFGIFEGPFEFVFSG